MNPSAAAAALLLAAAMVPNPAPAHQAAQKDPLEVRMRFQETVSLPGGLALRFAGYDDRRCPVDVKCVWPGEARAFFRLHGPGVEPQVLSLSLRGPDGRQQPVAVAARYRFVLRSLTPVPRMRDPVSPGEYTAVVELRETAAQAPRPVK